MSPWSKVEPKAGGQQYISQEGQKTMPAPPVIWSACQV